MISGPVGLGASPSVRPTSVDQPSESEYLSEAELIFDCFRERRNFRLRLPFFLPGGFAAMGLMAALGVDVFNRFACSRIETEVGCLGLSGFSVRARIELNVPSISNF